jgi:hypothetical protein
VALERCIVGDANYRDECVCIGRTIWCLARKSFQFDCDIHFVSDGNGNRIFVFSSLWLVIGLAGLRLYI